jgi:hypothetical protein
MTTHTHQETAMSDNAKPATATTSTEPLRLQILRRQMQIDRLELEIEELKTQPCRQCGGTVAREAYSMVWKRCWCLDSAPSSATSEEPSHG